MDVRLSAHAELVLKGYLATGEYANAEEVIEHALEVLGREASAWHSTGTSILELEGLGKEIWKDIDGQEYVDQERAAWNG